MNPDQEHFLIVPYGLLYSEVTASSLVRIPTHPFIFSSLVTLNETVDISAV